MVYSETLRLETRGDGDIVDITNHVFRAVSQSGQSNGIAVVFVAHSTCGITTVEYEPGLTFDMKQAFERIAPENDVIYQHNERWGDGNGHSHVRASLLGPSETIPFTDNRLILGTWQQVVLIDFDKRPRTRNVVLQIIGE